MNWMDEPVVTVVCLSLAVFRIYLETISFDFARLPLTARVMDQGRAQRFHRWGFYLSVLYFITFAPELLLA